jgi:cellulose biosynthesis protein BcsQ
MYTLRSIAVCNQKGGSGKTTNAVNLSGALGEPGHRVLLVDLDPQASASAWLGFRDGDRGQLDVFTGNVHLGHLARPTHVPNVDIVPLVEDAVRREIARLRASHTGCAPFPQRHADLIGGRPIGGHVGSEEGR